MAAPTSLTGEFEALYAVRCFLFEEDINLGCAVGEEVTTAKDGL
jgi:hypothetical protein